jgi:23S rRNA (uracil1939-C5)-methyltransferase
LDHRAEIFDFMNEHNAMIRFSHRRRPDGQAEPILEKTTPIITIGGYQVFVAPGMFLQASKAGEQALTETVLRYLGSDVGRVADLFCGIGTFTYPLARIGCQVEAYDVNESLLNGFRASVNAQMLHHVSIFKQNLFKYPPEPEELSRFDAVIFDPPRAGAAALVRQLAQVQGTKLRKVVAVSCNPHSFVNDARVLLESGYNLQNVTLVDQFVYSDHSELVALFTK